MFLNGCCWQDSQHPVSMILSQELCSVLYCILPIYEKGERYGKRSYHKMIIVRVIKRTGGNFRGTGCVYGIDYNDYNDSFTYPQTKLYIKYVQHFVNYSSIKKFFFKKKRILSIGHTASVHESQFTFAKTFRLA